MDITIQKSYGEENIQKDPEEVKLEQTYFKFETNPSFKKSTREFVQKLKTHFKNRSSATIECTSFINTVHNLFTQHTGKFFRKSKYEDFDKETSEEYFLYILKTIYENRFFAGKIFEHWRENKCRTLQDMNNYWMITANLDRLEEGNSEILNQNITMLSTEDLKANSQVAYNTVFDAIFKVLKKQNFLQPVDGSEVQKPKYLSNIQHFINTYYKSKEWSENEKTLIKSFKKLSVWIYNNLVDRKIMSDYNNKVKLNQNEIKNL